MEEKMRDALLVFLDIIYAVVYGYIVVETLAFWKTVIIMDTLWLEKIPSLVFPIMVFYFIAWDWLHARLLILKNPYRDYTRIFIDFAIAFCAYSATSEALKMNIFFLLWIALIFYLGGWWAFITIREYPQTSDRTELAVIAFPLAIVFGSFALGSLFYLYFYLAEDTLKASIVVGMIAGMWAMLFMYEINIPRTTTGIMAGPGVPFVPKERVDAIRRRFRNP